MMFLKICTEFMILLLTVYMTSKSTILALIICKISFIFKISLFFEFMNKLYN